jgi:hypothetical protein
LAYIPVFEPVGYLRHAFRSVASTKFEFGTSLAAAMLSISAFAVAISAGTSFLSRIEVNETFSKLFQLSHPFVGRIYQPMEFRVNIAEPAGVNTTLTLAENFTSDFDFERVIPTPLSVDKNRDTISFVFATPQRGSLNVSLFAKPKALGNSLVELRANVGQQRSVLMSTSQLILP